LSPGAGTFELALSLLQAGGVERWKREDAPASFGVTPLVRAMP